MMVNFFCPVLICLQCIFLSKMSVHVLAHLLIGLFRTFFTTEFWELFIYPRYTSFIRYAFHKYFLPGCNVSFHSPHWAKVLILRILLIFPFTDYASDVKSKNSLSSPRSLWFSPFSFLAFLFFYFLNLSPCPCWVNFCVICMSNDVIMSKRDNNEY